MAAWARLQGPVEFCDLCGGVEGCMMERRGLAASGSSTARTARGSACSTGRPRRVGAAREGAGRAERELLKASVAQGSRERMAEGVARVNGTGLCPPAPVKDLHPHPVQFHLPQPPPGAHLQVSPPCLRAGWLAGWLSLLLACLLRLAAALIRAGTCAAAGLPAGGAFCRQCTLPYTRACLSQ